ncbi:hypothetical protein EXIGLDRAFT_749534 [Exidia glandulosa HHB12029]|uniref:non-specific serine/threonine protein kinase n=1 Tax=Exidia glandulosa HHB12029 TaxID=1314781 RepID=A0A166AKA2_EXIGL|nr:hypothetical protein EXIGLDRAFT_749534 [Exidia glandulosa HHB12029]
MTVASRRLRGSSRHISSRDEDRLPEYCPFEPGAKLTLQLDGEPSSVEVQILWPFLPFSNGQALHVRLTAPHPCLPSNLLVKLFDRRFMCRDWHEDNDWSPASELAARTAWRRGAVDDREDVDIDSFGPEDPWLREKFPWMRMIKAFMTEREAYRRLTALQGTLIPKLFATLTWRDPQLDVFAPATHPMFSATPGLAMEFIEGTTLRDVAERKTANDWPTDAEERMSAKVLDIARALGKHGVIHGDIRAFNIMLRSPDSLDPVLIDFGHAVLRGEHETEHDWTERLREAKQINEFRRVLWFAHVHDPTPSPCSPEGDPVRGYFFLNWAADAVKSPAKRLEWFEPVPCDPEEPTYKMVVDPSDGVNAQYHFQRWRMRPGVRVRPHDEY